VAFSIGGKIKLKIDCKQKTPLMRGFYYFFLAAAFLGAAFLTAFLGAAFFTAFFAAFLGAAFFAVAMVFVF
jgi:hypothetical protein